MERLWRVTMKGHSDRWVHLVVRASDSSEAVRIARTIEPVPPGGETVVPYDGE